MYCVYFCSEREYTCVKLNTMRNVQNVHKDHRGRCDSAGGAQNSAELEFCSTEHNCTTCLELQRALQRQKSVEKELFGSFSMASRQVGAQKAQAQQAGCRSLFGSWRCEGSGLIWKHLALDTSWRCSVTSRMPESELLEGVSTVITSRWFCDFTHRCWWPPSCDCLLPFPNFKSP